MSVATEANPLYRRRKLVNIVMLAISSAALVFGLFWLAWILSTLLYEGANALMRPTLFTEMTPPPGSDGGLANAIAGSLIMAGIGTAVGTPVGILAGTYLAEYGKSGWLASDTEPGTPPGAESSSTATFPHSGSS